MVIPVEMIAGTPAVKNISLMASMIQLQLGGDPPPLNMS